MISKSSPVLLLFSLFLFLAPPVSNTVLAQPPCTFAEFEDAMDLEDQAERFAGSTPAEIRSLRRAAQILRRRQRRSFSRSRQRLIEDFGRARRQLERAGGPLRRATDELDDAINDVVRGLELSCFYVLSAVDETENTLANYRDVLRRTGELRVRAVRLSFGF